MQENSSRVAVKGFRLVACLLVAFASASSVSAQAPAKEGGTVRERRAADAGAQQTKEAPASKAVAAEESKGAAAKGEDAPAVEEEKALAEALVVEPDADSELEELRGRAEAEKNVAARGRLRRELVERLVALDRKAEAVSMLRVMLAEERFDPPFFYNVGNSLARLGESGAAVEAYRKASAQRRGNYSRAQHNLGVVLTRLGRWDEAEEALKTALRLENFNYAGASYNLGRLHALRGEAGLAIAEWTRTLRLKPDHADAAAALALALADDGDPREALAVIDAFTARAERAGMSVPRGLTIARLEIVASMNVPVEETGGARAPESPGAPARPRGSTKADLPRASSAPPASDLSGRDASAVIRGARAKKASPLVVVGETYDLLRRARAARGAERFEEAVSLYRQAIQRNGGYFAPANLELSYSLSALLRNDEAISSVLLVIERSGTRYPVAFYHLGRFYESAGQLAHAGESFARAVELMGEANPQFFADLSRVREKEGRTQEALAALESYVRASERLGDAPGWARERVAKLRQKAAAK